MTTPKHVLCTWEIGGELGHLTRLANITRELEQRNYKVTLALKDLSRATPVFAGTQASLVQAPVWLPKIKLNRPISCMADTLLLLGYLEPIGLQGLLTGWQTLTSLLQPDLIIYDFSPTAMLANRHTHVPKIAVGTGFFDPVPGHPVADWRLGEFNDDLIARQEARVLATINQVLAQQQQPLLQQFSDIFQVNHALISTFPELDIYQSLRQDAYYRPHDENRSERRPVQFPQGEGPKIVAYLKHHYPHLDVLLKGLAKCKARVFVASPGGQEQQFKPYSSSRFHYSTQVVELESAIAEADLYVGHGNMTSVTQSLMLGTPTIMVPTQQEQLLTGTKVEKLGMGQVITHIPSIDMLAKTFRDAATSERLRQKTLQFSQANRDYLGHTLSGSVADLCDAIF